jgi:hypothetical protein
MNICTVTSNHGSFLLKLFCHNTGVPKSAITLATRYVSETSTVSALWHVLNPCLRCTKDQCNVNIFHTGTFYSIINSASAVCSCEKVKSATTLLKLLDTLHTLRSSLSHYWGIDIIELLQHCNTLWGYVDLIFYIISLSTFTVFLLYGTYILIPCYKWTQSII